MHSDKTPPAPAKPEESVTPKSPSAVIHTPESYAPLSYYYDDATGYELFDPDNCDDDETE